MVIIKGHATPRRLMSPSSSRLTSRSRRAGASSTTRACVCSKRAASTARHRTISYARSPFSRKTIRDNDSISTSSPSREPKTGGRSRAGSANAERSATQAKRRRGLATPCLGLLPEGPGLLPEALVHVPSWQGGPNSFEGVDSLHQPCR